MATASPAYFSAVTNLHPVGYWPMHEVEAAAPGDIETNYGSLGPLGTGYYPDWTSSSPNLFQHNIPGALVGDSDPSVYFATYVSNVNPDFTNSLLIPHTSPQSTLAPPFSVECWTYWTNASSGNDIWSQNGLEGLNAGLTGGSVGAIGGIRFFGGGTSITLYNFNPGQNNVASVSGMSPNKWYHVVVTCDASTNMTIYTNGILAKTVAAVGKYTPDYWTPFEVGNGRGNTRAMNCRVDELAIYTNALQSGDIATHYQAGVLTPPTTALITPMFWRMIRSFTCGWIPLFIRHRVWPRGRH